MLKSAGISSDQDHTTTIIRYTILHSTTNTIIQPDDSAALCHFLSPTRVPRFFLASHTNNSSRAGQQDGLASRRQIGAAGICAQQFHDNTRLETLFLPNKQAQDLPYEYSSKNIPQKKERRAAASSAAACFVLLAAFVFLLAVAILGEISLRATARHKRNSWQGRAGQGRSWLCACLLR